MEHLGGQGERPRELFGAWAQARGSPGGAGIRLLDSSAIAGPLLTGAAYLLAAEVGELFSFPSAPLSALWAPNAVVLAALLLARRERWGLYLLTLLPFHLVAQLPDVPMLRVGVQFAVNSVQAVLGALAIGWLCPRPLRFDRVRPAAVLIIFGGFVAPFIASILMAAAFEVLNLSRQFSLTAIARTMTNAFGVCVFVPLIVHAAQGVRSWSAGRNFMRKTEAATLALALAIVCTFVFGFPAAEVGHPQMVVYAPALIFSVLPVMAWSAMRFGTVGACVAALFIGVTSTWGTLRGLGPFGDQDPVAGALALVSFQAVCAACAVMFAALLREWRHTEQQLLREEDLYSAVLASLHDEVAILDADGRIVLTNDSWTRSIETAPALRFDRVPVTGNLLAECAQAAHEGDRAAAAYRDALHKVLRGGEPRCKFEFSQSSSGKVAWFEIAVERTRRPEGGAVITRTNITARKCAELEARNQREQLNLLGRAAVLGQLSGAIAHELNQPLSSIMGNAEAGLVLLTGQPGDRAELKEILEDVVQDAERAAQVIRRLRALLGRGPVAQSRVDLNDLVRGVIELTHGEVVAHNIQVSTHFEERLPNVVADPVQIQLVVLNLLVNACDAVNAIDARERRISIATGLIPATREAQITVSDSGPGIPPADLERIFDPFVSSKKKGMGLGLLICRSAAEAHRGKITAENGVHGGAVFRLTLPIEAAGT